MSSLQHFSHSEHPLRLKEEDDIIKENARCYVCNKTVINSPTYTCTTHDTNCQSFYLHKRCAELPLHIHHHKHSKHSLALLPAPGCLCDVCYRVVMSAYTCEDCQFYACVFCAFQQRLFRHEGHQEHTLTLMQREALFMCDACGVEAKDSSYTCTTCEFWIHKSCAISPFIIPDPTYHHHPLNLVYSIPDMHRYFDRLCAVCNKLVYRNFWLYYCHKCTFFVHMKCATSSDTVHMINEIEADGNDNEPGLVQLPLCSEESLFDLIITQCGKFQVEFQGEGENDMSTSTVLNEPRIIEEHWSHKIHPLEQLQHTTTENDHDDNDDDEKVLICDGCIQPITASHPSYYACMQCGFFLHSFCATKLPRHLSAGASPIHPHHALLLRNRERFYSFVKYGACCHLTNGFYYHCELCDMKIDIRCAFLPARIKYKSHKHHSLVQRPSSNSICRVSNYHITDGMEYACETCSSFQIDVVCVFHPRRMKHKYDPHSIKLKLPPFFYEGVFYCEICEEQVNNQLWLYHCRDCDHSFHYNCLGCNENVKLGGTIELILDNQPHKLALVLKNPTKKNSPLYFCGNCGDGYKCTIMFECDGCGFHVCCKCVIKILDEHQVSSLLKSYRSVFQSLLH